MKKLDKYYAKIYDTYIDDEPDNPLLLEALEYFEKRAQQNMGIGLLWENYVYTKPNQDWYQEYKKIQNLLDEYIKFYANKNNKNIEDLELEFINYGQTQLVYVLTDLTDNSKITILAKQPVVDFGKIKKEADNLINLNKFDKNVISPIDYFSYKDQELYVTPYINQARCVASYENWGMYVPEPQYRFVNFTKQQEDIVTSSMIAKLISYFDQEKQEGISACKLGGGDFMLKKGWENMQPTYKNTFESLYFISAREKIKCSLKEYIEIIKREFSKTTINENQEELILNHRGRVPINMSNIEKGIQLGMSLLKEKQENFEK